MGQVASCRPVTAEARFPSLVCQCEFCRGNSGMGQIIIFRLYLYDALSRRKKGRSLGTF